MEEKDLVQLSREGSEEAFGELVKKYQTKMFNLAFSLTRNREVADDMAQEVFIKAYFALPRFQFKSEFGTWLYQIAVNHIRDYFRRQRRMSTVSIEEGIKNSIAAENDVEKRDQLQEEEKSRTLVLQTIQTLPGKYQIILSMRDIQGFSYGEIAKILKLSPGTVDSRLHRARRMLRKKIKPFFTQEGGEL